MNIKKISVWFVAVVMLLQVLMPTAFAERAEHDMVFNVVTRLMNSQGTLYKTDKVEDLYFHSYIDIDESEYAWVQISNYFSNDGKLKLQSGTALSDLSEKIGKYLKATSQKLFINGDKMIESSIYLVHKDDLEIIPNVATNVCGENIVFWMIKESDPDCAIAKKTYLMSDLLEKYEIED